MGPANCGSGARRRNEMRAVRFLFSWSRKVQLVIAACVVLALSLGCRRADDTRVIPPAAAHESYLRAGGSDPPAGKLSNPLTANARVVKDGEKLFSTMNCEGCHGGGALGWVGPSLVDGRWRYGGADDECITRSSTVALGECRHTAASCHPTQSGGSLRISALSRFRQTFRLSPGSRVSLRGPRQRERKHPATSEWRHRRFRNLRAFRL